MNDGKLSLYLFVLLFSFFGCVSEHKLELSPEALRGKAYFASFGCNSCHRIGNEGGTLGTDLTYVGFTRSPEWLDLWLKNPQNWKKNTLMPEFNLPDSVRKDLVSYLSTLKGELYRTNPPWNRAEWMNDAVKRGEAIFASVGCRGCHGEAGKGGYPNNNVHGGLIPSLTRVADGYSKDELKERIRKGIESIAKNPDQPPPMLRMPAWGEVLKEDELEALVEYLFSLRPPLKEEDAW